MLHFDRCIASICSDSGLFCRRKLKFLLLWFRSFPSAPRTLDFSNITHSQKHYKTSLKRQSSTRLRPRKHRNMQFHTGSVDFSSSRMCGLMALNQAGQWGIRKQTMKLVWNWRFCFFWSLRSLQRCDSVRWNSTFSTPSKSRELIHSRRSSNWSEIGK